MFLPQVILRFTDFKLDGTGYGDYVKVYDGLEENPRRLLRVLTAFDSRAPVAVVSSSGQLRVHFYADKINAARGFNVTYQVCSWAQGGQVLFNQVVFLRWTGMFLRFSLCSQGGRVLPALGGSLWGELGLLYRAAAL